MFEYVGSELEEIQRRWWPRGLRRGELSPASAVMAEVAGSNPAQCCIFRTLTDNTRGVEDAYVVLLIFTY